MKIRELLEAFPQPVTISAQPLGEYDGSMMAMMNTAGIQYINVAGKTIGDFVVEKQPGVWNIHIEVAPEYRRMGIASQVYNMVQKEASVNGARLVPSKFQTNDSKAFWSNRMQEATDIPHIRDDGFNRLMRRGHDPHITPLPTTQWNNQKRYRVRMNPRGGTRYITRPAWDDIPEKHRYYNPDFAELYTNDPGEKYIERTFARMKQGFSDEIPALGSGYIYRGGSQEEMDFFLQSGHIASHGSHNIGDDQTGLTYWSTDPEQAASYANSFAPNGYKATFEHPAYVWVARAPDPSEIRKVKGTGGNEVGVTRPIMANEIVQIWRGRVYDYDPGDIDLVPHDHQDNIYKLGSATMPSGQVVWERMK